MKRLAMYLAFAAGLYGPMPVLLANEVKPPHDSQAAFDYACKVTGYDCTGIAVPVITWGPLFIEWGYFGLYEGEATIAVDDSVLRFADPVFVQSVIAHETVHYLDTQLGYAKSPWTKADTCQSEFRAWRVGNAYVLTHGRADLVNYDWFINYNCFQGE